ncbi:CDP-glycerol--poly(glycerophosphate) glycerophosphotransferase [Chitinivibrio alkaliphilus]|uniref:CDP-Glycerol:Poly(Glycerophosphate) glycerophosphotransferase n=1 Tax=Chitinivibrio alkaliphilus ACht1 TaxID=1313304 RepID=U7D6F2_9BACT|nr:CDP-glycerol--poly(glycerophosphate) glycerophosphotransferase [Chitinivibrio alkaliphilus]ERP31513.1 CDP-Glycerol:Poly(glycerophosphate) glycerophosphotransferase [Chitinivibrio alkaliphilus ACht1]
MVNACTTPTKVFIQHGVIGITRGEGLSFTIQNYVRSLNGTIDIFCVSAEKEATVVEQMGIPREKMQFTGLPRWDNLEQSINTEILVFLTHSPKKEYEKKINDILSTLSQEHLKQYGYTIHVAIHNMMKERIHIPRGGSVITDNLAQYIQRSSLLITDNSSVSWDFIYKGNRVIFYKPDQDFWYIRPPYVEESVATSPEELMERIDDAVQSGCLRKTPDFFAHVDRHCCERVYRTVK